MCRADSSRSSSTGAAADELPDACWPWVFGLLNSYEQQITSRTNKVQNPDWDAVAKLREQEQKLQRPGANSFVVKAACANLVDAAYNSRCSSLLCHVIELEESLVKLAGTPGGLPLVARGADAQQLREQMRAMVLGVGAVMGMEFEADMQLWLDTQYRELLRKTAAEPGKPGKPGKKARKKKKK